MQARTILAHSKPLADSVLSGIKPLDVAYQEAIDSEKRACEIRLCATSMQAHPMAFKFAA